ncbi:MAG: hypothetical protein CVV17_13625, partial [Gammaproteobacteria bacterium HGW-Gammaproteobacteria-7]
MQAAFWLLFVFGRGLPAIISLVVLNTLSVLAMAEYVRAIRQFIGLSPRGRVLYSVVAGVALANVWFGLIMPDYDARVMAVSLPGAALMLWVVYSIRNYVEPGLDRASRIVAVVFLAGAAAMVLRAADTLVHPGLAASQSIFQQVALMVYANVPIFASLGFLLMQAGRANARLAQRAVTDPLTGALNRRGFESAAQRVLASSKRTGRKVSLLLIDADEFKRVNDAHGHAVGDAVLTTLYARLLDSLREEDILARLGGEEFVALLPGAGIDEAFAVAERLRASIGASQILFGDKSVVLTVSIGVAEWSARDFQIDPLLRRADLAMYAAKHGGRNRV